MKLQNLNLLGSLGSWLSSGLWGSSLWSSSLGGWLLGGRSLLCGWLCSSLRSGSLGSSWSLGGSRLCSAGLWRSCLSSGRLILSGWLSSSLWSSSLSGGWLLFFGH